MSHIAVFSAPAHGHVLPTLGVVENLIARGHRVTYVTSAEFADPLRALGARVCAYEPPPPPSESDHEATDADPSLLPMLFLRGSKEVAELARQQMTDDRPDLILYDALSPFVGRALSRLWRTAGVAFFPTYAACRQSTLMDNLLSRSGRPDSLEANLRAFHEALNAFLIGVGLQGTDLAEFVDGDEALNLVFLPRAFQPQASLFGDHFRFIGPNLTGRASQGTWSPPSTDLPVVYVSLGTVRGRSREFFRRCLDAFDHDDVHVVMAIGTGVDANDLGPLPANCEVHRRVPQLAVLEHADAFVTHGGMGSTMEALSFGVLLVVVPQSLEQQVTGEQVATLGLGLSIAPDSDPRQLRAAVARVRGDGGIAAAVRVMREHIRQAGGAVAAGDVIEEGLAVLR